MICSNCNGGQVVWQGRLSDLTHTLIPTNSEADLIINKMFVKLSDIDKDFKNDK